MDNIEVNQIKTNKKDIENNYIPISQKINSYQADITFYDQYSKQNVGYTALLVCLNINTRFVYGFIIKNKWWNEIYDKLQKFINIAKPWLIETDNGSEFVNNKIKKLFEDNNIEHLVFDKNKWKNGIAKVERFNRTIRDKITKYMKINKTNNWVNVIDKLLKNYNNTIHRSTNMKPSDADENKIHDIEWKETKEKIEEINKIFEINDHVRILKNKKLFWKGWQEYSKSIYKIIARDGLKYEAYNIDNAKIKFVLPYQMLKINMDETIRPKQTRQKNKQKMEKKWNKNEWKQKKF